MSRAASGDARLLRRAASTVALQVAAAVAVVVVAVAAAVLVIVARQQSTDADRAVRDAWSTADDVNDPPAGVWLISRASSGRIAVTEGAPAVVRRLDPAALPAGLVQREAGGHRLRIWTGSRKGPRISAVTDLSGDEAERHRLLWALAIACALGVVAAAGVGALIGRRAVRPLGRALVLQRRFVADASHELRTPLTVLLTRAQLLRRHLPANTPARVGADAERLVADTRVLGDVVADLLLSAELEHGAVAGETVDLAALAGDVVAAMEPVAAERGVTLRIVTDTPLVVRGAPTALRRSLMSLVDNALGHTAAGGHVTVRTTSEGSVARLSVSDDGEGLDPAGAASLVRRFARDTERDSGRRFGLGLALVDEVARAHGGRLRIEGAPGEGAVFTLELPGSRQVPQRRSRRSDGLTHPQSPA